MIIYGTWPMRMKLGQDSEAIFCSNCNQYSQWEIIRVITFFTLFFIPLIHYKMQYFLVCPGCDYCSIRISKADVRALRSDTKPIHEFAQEQVTPTALPELEPFVFDTDRILALEREALQKNNLITGGIGVLFFVLWRVWGGLGMFGIALMVAMLAFIPIQIAQFNRRKNKLPQIIAFEHGELWVDYEQVGHVLSARITSIEVKSSSIFPVPRYLTLKGDVGKKRYWLGSDASITDREYVALCNMLQQSLNAMGVTLKYSTRKSLVA